MEDDIDCPIIIENLIGDAIFRRSQRRSVISTDQSSAFEHLEIKPEFNRNGKQIGVTIEPQICLGSRRHKTKFPLRIVSDDDGEHTKLCLELLN